MELNINDRLHGFILKKKRYLEDQKADLYEMEYEKTGTRLAWLARKDVNKTFAIAFRTTPENDTGVFHILEHSTLNGSKKYPLREPFVDLLKSSMQTFLNAMTYPDKTMFPVSSRNDQDFLNLMDVYLDAVLHPAIYTNPNIFRQEGWHYEIHKKDDMPVYKGVVLNEMKGAFGSVDTLIVNEASRLLFPDNCYRFVSGGDPEHITDLTYEKFIETHQKYYHPSNAWIYLDGEVDLDASLAKIDSFLNEFDKKKMDTSVAMENDNNARESRIVYEATEAEGTQNHTIFTLAKKIGTYKDIKKIMAWSALSTLLAGNNNSPLKKAVLDEQLGEDVEVSVMDEMEQPCLFVLVRNSEEEKKDAVLNTIHACISDLCTKGLDHEQLKASLNQMEFRYREPKEPSGVINAAGALKSWLYDDDPSMYLNCGNLFEELRNDVDQGYFEKVLQEDMLDTLFSLITAVPSLDAAKIREEKEKKKLADHKAAWSAAQLDEIIEENKNLDAWQAQEDTPEQKASLPQLKLSDINPDPERIEGQKTEIKGVPVIVYPASDSGVVYMNLYFSLAGITRENLPSVSLYTDLLTRVPTASHSVEQLQQLIQKDIGRLSFGCNVFAPDNRKDACLPVIMVSAAVLKKNLDQAVQLITEIVLTSQFEKETVRPLVKQEFEDYRQSIIASGHSYALIRSAAHFSAEAVCREYLGGYASIAWLHDLDKNYDEKIASFLNDCEMYSSILFSSSRMYASVSGEENKNVIEQFAENFEASDFHRSVVHYKPLTEMKEGILIPSQVGYSASSINVQEKIPWQGAMRVLAQVMNYGYLWNEVRVKGGAYGTGMNVSMDGNTSMWSYRDPSPAASLSIYEKAPDFLDAFTASATDLSGFIIGTIASAEPLLTPGAKIHSADTLAFRRRSYEDRCHFRSEMLHTSMEDLKKISEAMRACAGEKCSVIIGEGRSIPADFRKREL